jgi:hypothetical protein
MESRAGDMGAGGMGGSQEQLEELKRENNLLTNSIREKNMKIDGLLKQIKLLDF